MFKVIADYSPEVMGQHTAPGVNAIEYYTENLQLAKEIAMDYVLPRDVQNNYEWYEKSNGSLWVRHEAASHQATNFHAEVRPVEPVTEMPDITTEDDRQQRLAEINGE